MNENIFFAAFFFPAAAAVLVFFMKYLAATLQARLRLQEDENWRTLAASAAASQAETATSLATVAAALERIQTHLGEIERILRAVE